MLKALKPELESATLSGETVLSGRSGTLVASTV